MVIPFDIKYRKEIESGKYQVVAGDTPARVICWDARSASGNNHIVAMVGKDGQPENILRFYDNGHLISDSTNRKNKDLYIVTPDDIVTLTEFERALIEFACSDLTIHNWSEKLLDLAKKEILGEYPNKKLYDMGFEAGMKAYHDTPLKINGWVARDKNTNVLCWYSDKPVNDMGVWSTEYGYEVRLDNVELPNVKYENSPQEYEIILNKL